MVDYQTISIMFTGLSVSLAAFYYIMTLRNTQKNQELVRKAQEQALETRRTQLLMHVFQEMSSEASMRRFADVMNMEWEDYGDYESKYGSDDHPEQFAKRLSVWRTFQGIGLLLKDGLVDADGLYDLIGSAVIFQWVKWESIFKEFRVRYGLPDDYELFESLYHEMMKVRRQRGITEDPSETGLKYIPTE